MAATLLYHRLSFLLLFATTCVGVQSNCNFTLAGENVLLDGYQGSGCALFTHRGGQDGVDRLSYHINATLSRNQSNDGCIVVAPLGSSLEFQCMGLPQSSSASWNGFSSSPTFNISRASLSDSRTYTCNESAANSSAFFCLVIKDHLLVDVFANWSDSDGFSGNCSARFNDSFLGSSLALNATWNSTGTSSIQVQPENVISGESFVCEASTTFHDKQSVSVKTNCNDWSAWQRSDQCENAEIVHHVVRTRTCNLSYSGSWKSKDMIQYCNGSGSTTTCLSPDNVNSPVILCSNSTVTSITLQWRIEGSGSVARSQLSYYREGHTVSTLIADVGTQYSATVDGLLPFSQYYFRVSVAFSSGNSNKSGGLVTVKTKPDELIINIVEGAESRVFVNWTSLAGLDSRYDFNSQTAHFKLSVFNLGSVSCSENAISSETSCNSSQLNRLDASFSEKLHLHASTFNFSVLSHRRYAVILSVEKNNGEFLQASRAHCFVIGRQQDAVPQNITGYNRSSTEIHIKWDPPACSLQNGSYVVVADPKPAIGDSSRRLVTKDLFLFIPNLSVWTTYSVRVAVLISDKKGPYTYSDPIAVRTDEAVPDGSPTISILPKTTNSTISISWLPPPVGERNGLLSNYRINGTDIGSIVLDNVTQYEIKNLMAWTSYTLTVEAGTSKGFGPPSDSKTVKTLESAPSSPPTNVAISNRATKSIEVTWNPPTDYQNGKIIKYNVLYRRTDETAPLTKTVSETRITLTGLRPGTAYTVRVAAATNVGVGPYNTPIPANTSEDTPSSPPTNVTISNEMETSFRVSWKPPPVKDQNGKIIDYVIKYGKRGGQISSKSKLLFTLTELTPGTEYTVEVSAATKIGPGPYSNITVGSTVCDFLNVTLVSVEVRNSTAVLITWNWATTNSSSNDRLISATYRAIPNESAAKTKENTMHSIRNSSGPFSHTMANLSPNRKYTIQVTACSCSPSYCYASQTSIQLPKERMSSALTSVIVVASLLVFVVLVLILITCYRRRKYRMFVFDSDVPLRLTNLSKKDGLQRPGLVIPRQLSFTKVPVTKENFDSYFEKIGTLGLQEEFEWLPVEPEKSWDEAIKECNVEKNRYIDIVPYDDSRLKLSPILGIEGSDYINASVMNSYDDPEAYLVTQGPLEDTIEDFWRMVWEQKSKIIVMLTNLIEKGRTKCHLYWPKEEPATYGIFTVTPQSSETYADFVISRFLISRNDESEDTLVVTHYHYIGWPDHGVPTDTGSILNFLRRIQQEKKANPGPMVVHCSAGVGRTGAFLAIDTMLERMEKEGDVDVFNYVLQMRDKRMAMVQTPDQYVYVHRTIRDAIQWGDTLMPVSTFKEYYHSEDFNASCEKQFKLLECAFLQEAAFSAARKPTNESKNRYQNCLPNNSFRVTLSLPAFGRSFDYINSSHVTSLLRKDFFKVTQAPLEGSVEDLWRMVWDQHCSVIVLMCHLVQGDEEHCFQFWPDSGLLEMDTFRIEFVQESKEEFFVLRQLKLVHLKSLTTNAIDLIHFMDWPSEDDLPKSAGPLLSTIVEVQKLQKKNCNRPVTVLCNNGLGRSGVFACLYSTVEQINCEQTVDVFQTARGMRLQRPKLVSHVEQYKFCCQGAVEYFDLYENGEK